MNSQPHTVDNGLVVICNSLLLTELCTAALARQTRPLPPLSCTCIFVSSARSPKAEISADIGVLLFRLHLTPAPITPPNTAATGNNSAFRMFRLREEHRKNQSPH